MDRHYTAEKLQSLGQKLYNEQKYRDALEMLNAAMKSESELSSTQLMAVVDRRAATYDKLENYDASLADGRKMLGIDKTWVQGYLRIGQVLQKMKKRDLALKIYERGLRVASVQSERYELLRKSHDKLARSLSPPKAIDMFAILPNELLEMIFSSIPFAKLCQCLRVCKDWRSYLMSYPAFWRKIDFQQASASKSVRINSLLSYIKYANGQVTQAYLKSVPLQSTKAIERLVKSCKKLENLTLASGGNLSQSLVLAAQLGRNLRTLHCGCEVPVDDAIIKQVMNTCPSLSNVTWDSVRSGMVATWAHADYPNLESWNIGLYCREREWVLRNICPPAQGLKELRLLGVGDQGIQLGTCNLAKLWPKLEELRICRLYISDHADEVLNPTGNNVALDLPVTIRKLLLTNTGTLRKFPGFSELRLREVGTMDADMLNTLLRGTVTPLSTFEALAAGLERQEILDILAHPRLKCVTHLNISASDNADDRAAEYIAETMKDLISLVLSSTRISGAGVKKIVQACAKLTRLDVSECRNVSPDAVEWVRGQGLHCLYTFAS